jgi:lipopolysaccharide/colanic/teichoic acid biosynthesis glycosyltransferase
MTVKRCFDVCASAAGLLIAAPVLLLAGLAIRMASPGPIFYHARRAGLNGETFVMHKLRTMHHAPRATGSPITAVADPRVFPVGSFLRKTKIDELPQLYDVLRGKMSLVGPRPEDPQIVADHYGPDGWETLKVLPGLSSPGALFHYLYADDYLSQGDLHEVYLHEVMPRKLALDVQYVRRNSLRIDLGIIFRTLVTILLIAAGKRELGRDLDRWCTSRRVEVTQRGAIGCDS